MAKSKKKFKRLAKRISKYNKSFISGYKRSVKSNVNNLTRNMLKSRVYARNVQNRKARMMAKDVNEKLRNLQKWGRYDTWASKQLINRLDSEKMSILQGKMLTDDGLINISNIDLLNNTQLANVTKAMNQFLSSKTKSIQGINAVVRKKRQDLIEKSDNAQWVKSLTNKEIEDLYRVFDDEEFKYLSDKVKYEQIWNTIVQANANGWSSQEFVDELLMYTDPKFINDDDVLDSMNSIYDKFVNIK